MDGTDTDEHGQTRTKESVPVRVRPWKGRSAQEALHRTLPAEQAVGGFEAEEDPAGLPGLDDRPMDRAGIVRGVGAGLPMAHLVLVAAGEDEEVLGSDVEVAREGAPRRDV